MSRVDSEFRWMLSQARAPKLRTMRRFAEEEIVVHTGPCKGRFRTRNQPFMGLWLDAVDSGLWRLFNSTGPRQGGKTLLTCVIPLMYHLFEIMETVIFAVPDLDIADDKFRENLLPAIGATRYAELLPTTGEGSRNGKVKNAVVFKNGATLKFMTGGASGLASDRGRQGYTARVIIVTEKSTFGGTGEASVEANKLEQIRACTNSFGDRARFYEESTLTTEFDPTYIDLKQGTDSRIMGPCPHCKVFVAPEREHLSGWQEAQSETEARANAFFCCPACGEKIDETERRTLNEQAVLVHRGQEVIDGRVVGELPPTDTLGFRFSAFQNMFRSAGDVAVDEWKAARSPNEDDAERKMCQFVWCLPFKSQVQELVTLSPAGLAARQGKTIKGMVPAECVLVTVGADVGKWKSWWQAVAWFANGASVVIAYGHFEMESEQLGEEFAILKMLRDLRKICEQGWTWEGHGTARPADLVSIDSAYKQSVVFQFVRECQADPNTRDRYWPVRGFGEGQLAGGSYHGPKKTGNQTRLIGDGYHVTVFLAERVHVIEFDADYWKTWFHERLSCDAQQPGAMVLFAALPKEHQQIVRHWTAERQTIEFVPNKGEVIKWKAVRRGNHWLDCGVGASIVGHFGGVRVLPEERGRGTGDGGRGADETPQPAVMTPDGRPFSILER
jgi:phage terminase large subunit GpA-like protein